MVILKETNPQNLFQQRLGVLEVKDNLILLTFDCQVPIGRTKFYKDDYVAKEFFTAKELLYMKKELNLTKLPFEVYDMCKLTDIYEFIRKV